MKSGNVVFTMEQAKKLAIALNHMTSDIEAKLEVS